MFTFSCRRRIIFFRLSLALGPSSWWPIYLDSTNFLRNDIKLAFLTNIFLFHQDRERWSDADVFSDRDEASQLIPVEYMFTSSWVIKLIWLLLYYSLTTTLHFILHIKIFKIFRPEQVITAGSNFFSFSHSSQLRDDPEQCKLQRFGSGILHSDEIYLNQTGMSFQVFWLQGKCKKCDIQYYDDILLLTKQSIFMKVFKTFQKFGL